MGDSATVICSVDVLFPSMKENIPALGTLAVRLSVRLVLVKKVELPSKDQVMSDGRGLALAMQEMLTFSPSTTVTVVVLRASTLRDTATVYADKFMCACVHVCVCVCLHVCVCACAHE